MKYIKLFEDFEPQTYIYHGTSNGALRRIIKDGLVPKESSVYFSSNEGYAQTYADRKDYTGGVLLRVIYSDKMKIADNIQAFGDGYLEYYTDMIIRPEELEIKHEGIWITLTEYSLY
tara:strand:- start:21 stop:371 length:351 start_codon:yes stop_codon:yes gene_type:complete